MGGASGTKSIGRCSRSLRCSNNSKSRSIGRRKLVLTVRRLGSVPQRPAVEALFDLIEALRAAIPPREAFERPRGNGFAVVSTWADSPRRMVAARNSADCLLLSDAPGASGSCFALWLSSRRAALAAPLRQLFPAPARP